MNIDNIIEIPDTVFTHTNMFTARTHSKSLCRMCRLGPETCAVNVLSGVVHFRHLFLYFRECTERRGCSKDASREHVAHNTHGRDGATRPRARMRLVTEMCIGARETFVAENWQIRSLRTIRIFRIQYSRLYTRTVDLPFCISILFQRIRMRSLTEFLQVSARPCRLACEVVREKRKKK